MYFQTTFGYVARIAGMSPFHRRPLSPKPITFLNPPPNQPTQPQTNKQTNKQTTEQPNNPPTQARSIVLTSPTVATVGLSLTIPLAFLSDAAMGKLKGGAGEVLGALAVTAGFVLVSWNRKGEVDWDDEQQREQARQQQQQHQRRELGVGVGGRRQEGDGGLSDGEWSVEED